MVNARTSQRALTVVACIGTLLLAALILAPHGSASPSIAEQEALDRYRQVMSTLHAKRAATLDPETLRQVEGNDPARTGLIGAEWSYLVTTQGTLEAKQASAHPVWVLLFMRWFEEAGVSPGDTISIGCSASFPALFYAARCAAEARGIKVRAVVSMTASNFGASAPGFDIWDMEAAVQQRGLLAPAVLAITPGGVEDRALYLGDEETVLLRQRLDTIALLPNAPEVEWPASLEDAVALRERLLLEPSHDGTTPSAFTNIGGNSANMGTGQRALLLPRGVILPGSHPVPRDEQLPQGGYGAIHRALTQDIPAINLLDVRSILAAHGIAVSALSDDTARAFPALRGVSPQGRITAALLAVALLVILYFLPRETSPALQIPTMKESEQ